MSDHVAAHYSREGIADAILKAARETVGSNTDLTPDVLAPADHLHGRGLTATRELANLLVPTSGEHLLDIGCGVGGPARWIAWTYGCRVTGIDLTPEFCNAAAALNVATGLAEAVSIVNASAIDLPFGDATFDGAWSHNVLMNVEDKRRFLSEAYRVLKPGGRLALMALISSPLGKPHYPTPWASTEATSFLVSLDEMAELVTRAGFEIVHFEDNTERTRGARRARAQGLASDTPPSLGTHLVMGPQIGEYQRNSLRNDEEGLVRAMEALLRRPE